ncbi:MAG: sugar phosphate isomerase/epimerase [Verrucomicrobia bacterium]|nr:sugar phosphate isomerase/epimerase [Verrucomicrobiota bacterium]
MKSAQPTLSRRSFLATAAAAAGFAVSRRFSLSAAEAGGSIEFGVCTSLKKAALLKQAGFQFVEENVGSVLVPKLSDDEFEKKLAEIKAAPLPIRSCTGFLPGDLKVVGPEVPMDVLMKHAEIVFRRAEKAGIGRIVFGSGGSRRIPDGFDAAKAREQFTDYCRRIAPMAQAHKVIVVIEALNKGECNFINRVSEALAIADAVNHPGVQVHADIYHMMREDEGPESILKAGAKVKHCHIAEKTKRTAPGVDGDDFRAYFKALKVIGYRGGLSIEGKWKDDQLAKAFSVLTEQLKTA